MIFSLYLYHDWFHTIISGQTIIPPFTLTYGIVWEQGTPSCGHSMGKLWKMIINQWSWGIPFDQTFVKGTVGEHPPWTTMISRFPRPLRLRDFPATFHWRVCRFPGSTAESSWLWIRTLAQHGSVGGQWVAMKYYVSYYEWWNPTSLKWRYPRIWYGGWGFLGADFWNDPASWAIFASSHFLVVEISISSYGADIFECINGLSSRLLVDVGSSYDFFAESVNQKILLTVRVRGFHVGFTSSCFRNRWFFMMRWPSTSCLGAFLSLKLWDCDWSDEKKCGLSGGLRKTLETSKNIVGWPWFSQVNLSV